MTQVTLEQYQSVERRATHEEARRGFRVHAVVTALVWILVLAINATVADEFPWSIFPIIGMGIGLWFHWHFGVVRSEELTGRRQADVERRARSELRRPQL